MSDEAIRAVEVQETQYDEVVVLDSPYDAKDFIKVLPWKDYEEELEEHGSLRKKAVGRGMGEDNVALKAVDDYVEQNGFPDDFGTHSNWDSTALGPDTGAWTIDRDSFEEARRFFEFCGFKVVVEDDVNL